ncbi:hypothetical protein [Amphritea atlantica]|uniref:hypothetical protein n=1 Tax=Amphritea atlantica TaxID=355243 RepID=UPI000B82275F|nr:hypothetical protein [Amphritea atlantica]
MITSCPDARRWLLIATADGYLLFHRSALGWFGLPVIQLGAMPCHPESPSEGAEGGCWLVVTFLRDLRRIPGM